MNPSRAQIPSTPLVQLLRTLPKGKNALPDRRKLCDAFLTEPERLANCFAESVELVASSFRSLQPFYPSAHRFGHKPSGKPHGEDLVSTVDVACRLAQREEWPVEGNRRLDFAYVDRELELGRCNPGTEYATGCRLRLDLFLVNVEDRTPILAELKIRADQDSYYALLQLLAMAAYAVTETQRARLALWGSTPARVLSEEVPTKVVPPIDLYLLSVDAPQKESYRGLAGAAKKLSAELLKQPEIAGFIRRIAWLQIEEEKGPSLRIEKDEVFTRPREMARLRHDLPGGTAA